MWCNKIPDTGDWLPRSPIIAINSKKPFDQVLVIEQDERNAAVLRKRIAVVKTGSKVTVHIGDANEKIHDILSGMPLEKPLVFVFVDPEGMEIRWETIQAIAERFEYTDFMFNLTYGAGREMRAVMETGKSPKCIEDFTGLSIEKILISHEGDVPEAYKTQIEETLGKKYGNAALIRNDTNHPIYHLLLYARETRGGSPWHRAYSNLFSRLGSLETPQVEGALSSLKKRGLDRFT